jgi:hypothetical protein
MWQNLPPPPVTPKSARKPLKTITRRVAYALIFGFFCLGLVVGCVSGVSISSSPQHTTLSSQPSTSAANLTAAAIDTANRVATNVAAQSTQDAAATSTDTSATAQNPLGVGDTGSNDNWSMTLNSVKTNTGDDIDQPGAGAIYLIVDVTVKNVSSSAEDISSDLSFRLEDSTGQVYDEQITDFGTPPDGTIQPNAKLRGQLVYDVPKSQHNFTLEFLGSGFDGTTGVWAFKV